MLVGLQFPWSSRALDFVCGASRQAGGLCRSLSRRAVESGREEPIVTRTDPGEPMGIPKDVLEADDVFEQTIQELALDVRELLITDANLYFVGPDIEAYQAAAAEVADLLNFTAGQWHFKDLQGGTQIVDKLEHVWTVPPLISIQRWVWPVMRTGLVIWLDPDGYKKLSVYERERLHKIKHPKKKDKPTFGPPRPPDLLRKEVTPPSDPVDMWQEADVHVDLTRADLPAPNLILGSIINAILESPPKWRGWMKQAKARGTVEADFETPLEVRRSFHSHGVSPRLNRLLNA